MLPKEATDIGFRVSGLNLRVMEDQMEKNIHPSMLSHHVGSRSLITGLGDFSGL